MQGNTQFLRDPNIAAGMCKIYLKLPLSSIEISEVDSSGTVLESRELNSNEYMTLFLIYRYVR